MTKQTKKNILVVGAGISGISIARLLKDQGNNVTIYEKSTVIGGQCYDSYNKFARCYCGESPHIFHTNNKEVWTFVNRFAKFNNYKHKVYSIFDRGLCLWPISRTSQELNSFLNVGKQSIFKNYIENYSKKSWKTFNLEVIKNIKSRFKFKDSFNNDFFLDKYQGMPIDGYNKMFSKMLKGIKVLTYRPSFTIDYYDLVKNEYDIIIFTGSIDEFFDYSLGDLEYMSLKIEDKLIQSDSQILPSAVVNLPNHENITRITEYNIFYNSTSKNRFLSIEKPIIANRNSSKIYPVLTYKNIALYNEYVKLVKNACPKLVLHGRLGNYKYINMDECILQSIILAKQLKGGVKK